MYNKMIRLVKSTFYQEEKTKKKLSDFILSASYLSLGKECLKFERNFAIFQSRKHCTFFNSGSSANLALMQALVNLGRVGQKDYVGFSALTWPTNVMPIIQLGMTQVPIDVELDTLNVSSKKFLEVLNKYPLKMLFITNLLGFCDDLDEIRKICEGNKIILIEDNCESLGTVYKGEKLGNFGLASTFSFFVGHHMSTIEGGAVCTNDDELDIMLRLVRAHGWDRNLQKNHQKRMRRDFDVISSFYAKYTFYNLAFNLRPTEINAFIGNLQLKWLNKIIQKKNKNFLRMAKVLYKKKDKYFPIKYDHIDFISNFAVPLVCKSGKIRDQLVKKCGGKVEIRPIVGGDMTKQPFFSRYSNRVISLPKNANAKLIHNQGLYFGNNPELSDEEIRQCIQIFS